MLAVAATTLLLASCSSSDGETSVLPDETASTIVETGNSLEVESTTSVPPTTSTVPAVPTEATEPATGSDATEICTALATDGYESQKQLVDAQTDDDLAQVEAECGDDLDRLQAIRDIENATALLGSEGEPVSLESLQCSDGQYSFIATSRAEVPIGVHLAFRIFLEDDEEPYRSANYPLVIWSLDPGQSQGITGDFDVPDGSYRCGLTARVFNADSSEVDTGPIDPDVPTLTGDDPTTWFGAMLGREVDSIGTGNADAASVTEDVRSTGYEAVVADTAGDDPPEREPLSVTICNGTVDQPDPDRMSFVYFITYPSLDDDSTDATESSLRHGLFRRGSDGQWRWLSSPQYFNAEVFWECGRPTDAS